LPISWLTVELLSSGQLNAGATGVDPGEDGPDGSATVAALLEAGIGKTETVTALELSGTVTVVVAVLSSETVEGTKALTKPSFVTVYDAVLDRRQCKMIANTDWSAGGACCRDG
jgi:hypothetical protein